MDPHPMIPALTVHMPTIPSFLGQAYSNWMYGRRDQLWPGGTRPAPPTPPPVVTPSVGFGPGSPGWTEPFRVHMPKPSPVMGSNELPEWIRQGISPPSPLRGDVPRGPDVESGEPGPGSRAIGVEYPPYPQPPTNVAEVRLRASDRGPTVETGGNTRVLNPWDWQFSPEALGDALAAIRDRKPLTAWERRGMTEAEIKTYNDALEGLGGPLSKQPISAAERDAMTKAQRQLWEDEWKEFNEAWKAYQDERRASKAKALAPTEAQAYIDYLMAELAKLKGKNDANSRKLRAALQKELANALAQEQGGQAPTAPVSAPPPSAQPPAPVTERVPVGTLGDETEFDGGIITWRALIESLKGKTDAESNRKRAVAEKNIAEALQHKIKANHDAGFAQAAEEYAKLSPEELAQMIPDLKKMIEDPGYSADQKAVLQGVLDYIRSRQPQIIQ